MVTDKAQVCRNAMEFLVAEEIEKQLKLVPARLAKYLNVQEISAFALNRLPALYATSERGWRQQCLKGKRDYREKIKQAVRQGLAAVQKDPLRVEVPLAPATGHEVEKALAELRLILQCEDLSWQNLASKVKESLAKAARENANWQSSRSELVDRNAWYKASSHYRY